MFSNKMDEPLVLDLFQFFLRNTTNWFGFKIESNFLGCQIYKSMVPNFRRPIGCRPISHY